ncbi:hypothetical protein V6N13_085825 [Hibiscus sabdariffa]
MAALRLGSLAPAALTPITVTKKCERFNGGVKVVGDGGGDNGFPPFLPKEVEKIKDPFARNLARRIKRLPVQVLPCVNLLRDFMLQSVVHRAADRNHANRSEPHHERELRDIILISVTALATAYILREYRGKKAFFTPFKIGCSEGYIMSSCVQPLIQTDANPVALLHCFDSSCLEWRRAYPLLEEAGLEAWALDVLGWGFSDLGRLPPCNVASKRYHLYQLWKSYIKRPVVLVGPSLGAAVAIDFAVNYPEAVEKLVLINPSVYAEGTGNLAKLPKVVAYAGVSLLKTLPLRLYANLLAFDGIPLSESVDWANVGRLHCHMPWWKEATVNFMVSGGYNVVSQIKQVNQKTLIICGENDKIVSNQLATRLLFELPNASMQRVPDSGHLTHVDKPRHVVKLIADFARAE